MTREEAREAYGNSEYTDEIIKAIEQEPFMNKTCVSSKVCEHDKGVVLDKIRAEIKNRAMENGMLAELMERQKKFYYLMKFCRLLTSTRQKAR